MKYSCNYSMQTIYSLLFHLLVFYVKNTFMFLSYLFKSFKIFYWLPRFTEVTVQSVQVWGACLTFRGLGLPPSLLARVGG